MAKWSGMIGYVKPEEVERGVWSDGVVTEYPYYGELISSHNRMQQSIESTNSNVTLSNNVSIIADSYAISNFGYMKYAIVNGVKWNITDVEIKYPRLILVIGGIYNGK